MSQTKNLILRFYFPHTKSDFNLVTSRKEAYFVSSNNLKKKTSLFGVQIKPQFIRKEN